MGLAYMNPLYNDTYYILYIGMANLDQKTDLIMHIIGAKLSKGVKTEERVGNNHPFTPDFYLVHEETDILFLGDDFIDLVTGEKYKIKD